MAHTFISQGYLNKKSVIPSNVDWDLIQPIIEMSQINDIMPFLGSDYYDELITQSTSPTSFTGLNKSFLDNYVMPCALNYFLAKVTPFLNYRYTNKTTSTQSYENGQALTRQEVDYLVDLHRNTAEEFKARAQKYLRLKGATYFPTYFSSNNQTLIPPDTEAFDSPLYLPDEKFKSPYPNWGDIR